MATNAKLIAELLESDGDVKASALDNANVAIKVYSVTPQTVSGASGVSVVIIGEGFVSAPSVHFISALTGAVSAAGSVTFNSVVKLTVTTPQLAVADEPWTIRVTNPNGQSAAIESILDAGGSPTWSTAAGKVGSDTFQSTAFSTTVAASDPDGTAIAYSESGTDVLTGSGSGKLGFAINSSSGAITGTMPALSSNTTFNFTLGASDGTNLTTRAFNIVGKAVNVWNYNPMTSFTTQTGSWTNSSTVIAQNGASYGTQGRAISGAGQKALSGVWNLDFQLNKTQTNSSPYPGYNVSLNRLPTSLAQLQSNRYHQSLMSIDFGNNYGTYFYVKKASDASNLHTGGNIGSSTFGQAGCAYRITYDVRTGVFVVFAQANGNYDSMTQRDTYTLPTSEKAAWDTSYLQTDFAITVGGRGGTDGVRNVRWVSAV